MGTYNCGVTYLNGTKVKGKNVTFERADKPKNTMINKVISISGDAPIDELMGYDGAWLLTGENILANSFFDTMKPKMLS